MDLIELRQQLKVCLCKHFNISELKTEICFEMGIHHEDIGSVAKQPDFVVELIYYCERRSKLYELWELCRKLRPNFAGPQIPVYDDENIEQTPPSVTERSSDAPEFAPSELIAPNLHKKSVEVFTEKENTSLSESSSNMREKVVQAEKDGDRELAARLCMELAGLLEQEGRYVQAREFARRSATHFLTTGLKEEALEQHLFAVRVWISQTVFPGTLAGSDLKEAEKIASEVDNYTLRARVLLLKAQYTMLPGNNRSDVETIWAQVDHLLPKTSPEQHIELATELAIQRAMFARLDEDWGKIEHLLVDAKSRDWSIKSTSKRLELLWCLLFHYSETGAWHDVDRIYDSAHKLLGGLDNSQEAKWLMHRAGSLARRGDAKGAVDAYLGAIGYFTGEEANRLDKHHFFQDMISLLAKHGRSDDLLKVMKYDVERLELASVVICEDIGYLHIKRAKENFFHGNVELAFGHAEYALIHAWRKGDWSMLNEAKKALAVLHHAKQDYISATLAAVGSVPQKVIEEYARHLENLKDSDEIRRVVDTLLQDWPTRSDQNDALTALNQCVNIVPFDRLERTIEYATSNVSRYITSEPAANLCRTTLQLLRLLAPRYDQSQAQGLILFGVEILRNEVDWITSRAVLQLLGAIFEAHSTIEAELYQPSIAATLDQHDKHLPLQPEAKVTLVEIAINAPPEARATVTTFFQEHSDWDHLAILKEPISDENVRLHVQRILSNITPHREEGKISLSGRRARSINNFNEYFTPSLADLVVAGLLKAVWNPEGFLTQKSDAILALRWLPEDTLGTKANEISTMLLEVIGSSLVESGVNKFLGRFGDEDTLRRNSLYTLGHLYCYTQSSLKKKIRQAYLSQSRNSSARIRMGVAMALRTLHSTYQFPTELMLTLVELLQDKDPEVRHWAASAAGHRIADQKIPKSASEFIIRRLLAAATDETDARARAGVAYGLRILQKSENVHAPLQNEIQRAINRLQNDVNYQVTKLASG